MITLVLEMFVWLLQANVTTFPTFRSNVQLRACLPDPEAPLR